MSGPVEILTFVTGLMATNTFLVRSGEACWVIDPGFSPGALLEHLGRSGLVPDRVVLTHGHCDHIAGIAELRAAVGEVSVWCPAGDAEMLTDAERNLSAPFGFPVVAVPPDRLFRPGDVLGLGGSAWQVLDTSGHSPGGVSLYCAAEGAVFTGDALFAQGIGRTDFHGGNLRELIANIRDSLLSLPDETKVYPGHGPATTIGQERRFNPFLAGGIPN